MVLDLRHHFCRHSKVSHQKTEGIEGPVEAPPFETLLAYNKWVNLWNNNNNNKNQGLFLQGLLEVSVSFYPQPFNLFCIKDSGSPGTSLVVQWLRICLPTQGHRFEPRSGKIPHAAEQLRPCATTTAPREPGARAPQQEKPPQ